VASAASDVEQIADALGLARFAVMGASGGGPHALACAALLPTRVSSVACLASLAPFLANRANGADGAGAREAEPARIPAAAAVSGSAILRGGPTAPTARPMRESLGDQPLVSGGNGGPSSSGPKPGYTPSGARIGRERSVLVRIRRQVQEVPRALTATARRSNPPT